MRAGIHHLVPLTKKSDLAHREAIVMAKLRTDLVFLSARWRLENKRVSPTGLYHAMVDIIRANDIRHAIPHDLSPTGSTALTSHRIGAVAFIRSNVLGQGTTPAEARQ